MIQLRSLATRAGWVVLLGALIAHGAHAADADRGKAVFEKCAACHSLEPGKDDDGPSLASIFGRKAGSLEDFRYSRAMRQSNFTWDEGSLSAFIIDPQGFLPGNRMPFDGITDPIERGDLIAYLKVATKVPSSTQLTPPHVNWAAAKGFLVQVSAEQHVATTKGTPRFTRNAEGRS